MAAEAAPQVAVEAAVQMADTLQQEGAAALVPDGDAEAEEAAATDAECDHVGSEWTSTESAGECGGRPAGVPAAAGPAPACAAEASEASEALPAGGASEAGAGRAAEQRGSPGPAESSESEPADCAGSSSLTAETSPRDPDSDGGYDETTSESSLMV